MTSDASTMFTLATTHRVPRTNAPASRHGAIRRLLCAAVFLLCSWGTGTWAFDLSDLAAQLKATPVVKGTFTQEKFLRALPLPLTSAGHFILSSESGLLWILEAPIAQTVRITARGMDAKNADGPWQKMTGTAGPSRQNALLVALMQGDTVALQEQFNIVLTGDGTQWTMKMTPRAALLRQIFDNLQIDGGARVQKIRLNETQGDYTVLTLIDTIGTMHLEDQEQRAFTE